MRVVASWDGAKLGRVADVLAHIISAAVWCHPVAVVRLLLTAPPGVRRVLYNILDEASGHLGLGRPWL